MHGPACPSSQTQIPSQQAQGPVELHDTAAKCLKDIEELFVVNPSWYLNYITLEEDHKIINIFTII